MTNYRRRSESIEAMQFTGGTDNAYKVVLWVAEKGGKTLYGMGTPDEYERILVDIPSGGFVTAYVNDWIILHEDGRFDVKHPFFFDNTYEEESNHMVVTYKTFAVDLAPENQTMGFGEQELNYMEELYMQEGDKEEDPGFEAWLAKQKEDEIWWEKNRRKMFFYTLLGVILIPPAMAYEWFVTRKEPR